MSEPTDRYEAWRDNLRATLKWYVGALVSLGTLLAGSLGFSILPDLSGGDRYLAAALGAIAICLILRGIWVVHLALAISPFPRILLREDDDVRRRLEPYLDTLLAGSDITSLSLSDLDRLDALLDERERIIANPPVNEAELAPLSKRIAKIASFASYQTLQDDFRQLNAKLMGLFICTAAIVGFLTVFWSDNKTDKPPSQQSILFQPGTEGWSDYAQALAESCAQPGLDFAAKGIPDKPFEGWWTITLDGPTCKGMTLAVPGAVVQASSSASQ